MSSGPIFQSMRRLACFAAIADAGSIKGGAQRLGLSVPVVSTALAELEEELNVMLAIRSTRKLELTTAGGVVYEHAQTMLTAADRALSAATNDRVANGELRITTPVELGSHWLPKYLLRFNQEFPRIKLTVDANDSVVALHSSEFDMAIQANHQAPTVPANIKLKRPVIALGKINLLCVATKKASVRWQENTAIMNTALLELKERGDSLTAVEKKTSQTVTIRGNHIIRTNSHETAVSMAREGMGAVLIMEETVREDLKSKRLTKLFPSYNFGHLNLELKVRDSLPSPPTRAFINFMKEQQTSN